MILKPCRNTRWVEIWSNLKNFDVVISNLKVCRHNCHFDVATTNQVESLHCFFIFGWIKLQFGVKGNLRLLITNLN